MSLAPRITAILCNGADGRCDKDARRDGLCWGHYERIRNAGSLPVAAPLRERAKTPFDGICRAALNYRDELDTATDEEHHRDREKIRDALRLYTWAYVPRLLRRHIALLEQVGGVEKFLAGYGDKRGHAPPRRKVRLGG